MVSIIAICLLSLSLPALLSAQSHDSVTVTGIYTDAACTVASNTLNAAVPSDGTCSTIAGLGAANVTYANGKYNVKGYSGSTCSGTPSASFSFVNLNSCTGSGSSYLLLSTTLSITGSYIGATCSGTPISSPSTNAVGAVGRPACTTTGSNSIAIALLPGFASFSVAAYQSAGCSGSPSLNFNTSGASGVCSSGGYASMMFGGTGTALTPSGPSSPSPSVAPTTPSTPYIGLVGIYSDPTCTTLFPGSPLLNAVGIIPGCTGLPGLGSGRITVASSSTSANPRFNLQGYAGVTDCSGSALAQWVAVPVGICTASAATPLPGAYALLAPTINVASISTSADCSGTNLLKNTVAIVGVNSQPSCSKLTPFSGSTPTSSVSIIGAGAGYTVAYYPSNTLCANKSSLVWRATSAVCCTTNTSISLQLAGLASNVATPTSAATSRFTSSVSLLITLCVGLIMGLSAF